ncbi:MAG TPA: type II toxin-antitoxin system PemK/MazF family toxin [Verrucomicrobiae bacterium]|jgi:mRNA-degrading endonuclease toxin of MazEF toxin-antitoxin module
MKQWDIFTWEFPEGSHPAVIVSHPQRIADKEVVNVLLCSSQRARRAAEINEVILDEADGLDWPTLCKCDLLYNLPKTELTAHRGSVTPIRRRQIVGRIISAFGWSAI